MKYLCLDYGSKKIGVSISDETGILAFPLKIISNKNKEKSLEEILQIVKEKNIKEIVIGESLKHTGAPNDILEEAKSFAKHISEISDLKIHFEKEWYSTVEARRYDDRKDADDSAAAIILQRFLDKVNKK